MYHLANELLYAPPALSRLSRGEPMRNAVVLTSLLGVALLAGCPDRTISEVSPEQGRVEYKDIPVNVSRKVDILFVIDDSPSMADKQKNLKANFPNFINVLNTIQGGLPDVHIGVVTSDHGTSGADGKTAPALPGSVGGCSSTGKTGEQHTEAAKRALQSSNTANAGFLRPDAFLAIIIVADEDDCSMQHSTLLTSDTSQLGPLQAFRCTRYGITCDTGGGTPDAMNQVGPKGMCHSNESGQYLTKIGDYVTFFKGLKPDAPSKVIVAAIAGVTTPVETALRAPSGSSTALPALAHSSTSVDTANMTEVGDPAIRM